MQYSLWKCLQLFYHNILSGTSIVIRSNAEISKKVSQRSKKLIASLNSLSSQEKSYISELLEIWRESPQSLILNLKGHAIRHTLKAYYVSKYRKVSCLTQIFFIFFFTWDSKWLSSEQIVSLKGIRKVYSRVTKSEKMFCLNLLSLNQLIKMTRNLISMIIHGFIIPTHDIPIMFPQVIRYLYIEVMRRTFFLFWDLPTYKERTVADFLFSLFSANEDGTA